MLLVGLLHLQQDLRLPLQVVDRLVDLILLLQRLYHALELHQELLGLPLPVAYAFPTAPALPLVEEGVVGAASLPLAEVGGELRVDGHVLLLVVGHVCSPHRVVLVQVLLPRRLSRRLRQRVQLPGLHGQHFLPRVNLHHGLVHLVQHAFDVVRSPLESVG